MPKTKKLNPRRIPLAKKNIDTDKILDEATRDDISHAWLLVADALLNQEHICADELSELADAVNRYIKNDTHRGQTEIFRAEHLLGIKKPRVDLSYVRSEFDLEKFKKKVGRIALYTGLCVVFLGLESTGRFTTDDLRRIFFSADLTLAEIDRGVNSYEEIERNLLNRSVYFEMLRDA